MSNRLIKQNKIITCLMLVLFVQLSIAQSIDIGIFESTTTANQIDIKIRPDFDIEADETITAILYTVRWNEPLITINTEFIFPYFISPQGLPVENEGYYYQVFAAVPVNAEAILANQEIIASSFTFANGECESFEIIEDDWTQANNGNFYIEFLGENVTGIIFEPFVEFGSVGGLVAGSGTINLGESTGNMILSAYNGNINSWQKRINEGSWNDIATTSGLINYSEIPLSPGSWEYRCEIQQGECPVAYSEAALFTVLDTITGMFSEIASRENNIAIYFDGSNICIKNLHSKNLDGKVLVNNLMGQKIFEKNISQIKTYNFKLDVHGILIVSFIDEPSGKLYQGKLLIK